MTREEALKVLDTIPTIGEQVDALDMAIEALEKEPCDDAISRQAVIDEMGDTNMDIYTEEVKDFVRSLPPVIPQTKAGRWIFDAFDEMLNKHYYCSECKSMGVDYWDFCPNCGAKMEVEG